MAKFLTEEGRYRATPIAWDVIQSDSSKSVGVRITYMCTTFWNTGNSTWVAFALPLPIVDGTFWFTKRDGMPNERAVRDLANVLKWDGDPLAFVEDGRWKPPACEIVVEAEEYKGQNRLRVKWINESGSRGQGREIAQRVASMQGDNFKRIIAGQSIEAPSIPADMAIDPSTVPF